MGIVYNITKQFEAGISKETRGPQGQREKQKKAGWLAVLVRIAANDSQVFKLNKKKNDLVFIVSLVMVSSPTRASEIGILIYSHTRTFRPAHIGTTTGARREIALVDF